MGRADAMSASGTTLTLLCPKIGRRDKNVQCGFSKIEEKQRFARQDPALVLLPTWQSPSAGRLPSA
jgi:hypothetical protein